jgi:hypothetical protein
MPNNSIPNEHVNKIIESIYGYFADEWVRITLPNYID